MEIQLVSLGKFLTLKGAAYQRVKAFQGSRYIFYYQFKGKNETVPDSYVPFHLWNSPI